MTRDDDDTRDMRGKRKRRLSPASRDDEDTVRVRRDSIMPSGVFSTCTPTSVQPDTVKAHEAIDQLDRDWRAECSKLQLENEGLRHRNSILVNENGALRDALHQVRGLR